MKQQRMVLGFLVMAMGLAVLACSNPAGTTAGSISSDRAIMAFNFAAPAVTGVITKTTKVHAVAVTVPFGTTLTALVPTIAITGISISPESGAAQDFSGPVAYTLTALNGTTMVYTVTVTIGPASTYGVTYSTNHATSGTVPAAQTKIQGTSLTLAANSGSLARIGYSFAGWNTLVHGGGTTYAEGATYATDAALTLYAKWTVQSPTADLSSLTLSGTPTGYAFSASTYVYNGIIVPNSTTDITVTPTGAGTITVNGTAVASGSASGSIALTVGSATTITVVATEEGKTAKTYTLSVTRLLAIGDSYGGGIVGYILLSNDPGYSATVQHGLIAATADQSAGIIWAVADYQGTTVPTPGATGTAVGAGLSNTNAIIAQNGGGTSYAAGLARAYNGGGYNDWFLPSRNELNDIYANRTKIGGFGTACYWSSSEYTNSNARLELLNGGSGTMSTNGKGYTCCVRAVRAF